MARAKKHKDVEYMVEGPAGAETMYFNTSEEASAIAIARSISRGGEPVLIDVLVSSKAGARFYGGDWAEEEYEEDPEASVFERITVRASSEGRVS